MLEQLLKLSPDHELMVVNDVIVFFPGAALAAVSNHAKSYGTDWLARLHQLAVLEQVRDQLEAVAAERLAALEELAREYDLQAAAASERLAVIEELTRERDLAAQAAARLAHRRG